MQVREYIKLHPVYLDGGMGTQLQKRGLRAGEASECWNLTHGEDITAIHKAYFDAGSNVVATNTFGANALKYDDGKLEQIISAAVENAKRARAQSSAPQEKWIALDVGPTGKLLRPFGDLDFETAVAAFQKTVALGAKYGVDLVLIETMSDLLETKAAVLAAKAACSLPIFVSNAYGENGRLMTGATPQITVAMLEGLRVDAIGVNCSFGPKQLCGVVREYLKHASLPVLLKPNAGLPQMIDGENVYTVSPSEFAADVSALMREGVRLAGGCCGTTPEHIAALTQNGQAQAALAADKKSDTVITSRTKAVVLENAPILIGAGLDPTQSSEVCQALQEGDTDTLIDEALAQQDEDMHVLSVSASLQGVDEKELLTTTVCELQTVVDLPLLLRAASADALEVALRRYNGKPLAGPVTAQNCDKLLALIKQYGAAALVLTADGLGVPKAAQDRVQIADRIASLAAELGIGKKDLVFAPSMQAPCDEDTLLAVKMLCERGYKTLLPISEQDAERGAFSRALACGLSAAIVDPYCKKIQQTYHDFLKQNT